MLKDSDIINIQSRIKGLVVYVIPDLQNLRREFTQREVKKITFEELRMLVNSPGGKYLVDNFLYIDNQQALDQLNIHVEPEYYYGVKEITELLTKGTLDEFLDCLDFAPQGVLNVVKELAISLPLNDMAKRQAILDKLNFDVSKAIELTAESEEEKIVKTVGKRRAAVPFKVSQDQENDGQSGRRVQKQIK